MCSSRKRVNLQARKAQVARKFVPMVCCKGLLAIMDQHAADERVCLERLRAEVRCLPGP